MTDAMTTINLNKKIFRPVKNSKGGTVTKDSIFVFRQTGTQFLASYSGGQILTGHMIGVFETPSTARLHYHCLTQSEILKSGQANARFSQGQGGRVLIDMEWRWIAGGEGNGTSSYEEVIQNEL